MYSDFEAMIMYKERLRQMTERRTYKTVKPEKTRSGGRLMFLLGRSLVKTGYRLMHEKPYFCVPAEREMCCENP